MLLEDKHFLFDESMKSADGIRMIRGVFENKEVKNKDIWLDERLDVPNSIYYTALEYWINPIWLLVCLQRERSLLGQVGDNRDFDFAMGFVGQHGPGSKNESWNGLGNQIQLAARSSAWSLGSRPEVAFRRGGPAGKLPSWKRWKEGGVELELLSDKPPYQALTKHTTTSRAQHVQLVFTPTSNWEHLLKINGEIYQKWVEPFYC